MTRMIGRQARLGTRQPAHMAGINESIRYMGDDDCRILLARHGDGAWELHDSRDEGDLV